MSRWWTWFNHKRNLVKNTGGGGQNRPCVLRNLIYEGVKVKRGGRFV